MLAIEKLNQAKQNRLQREQLKEQIQLQNDKKSQQFKINSKRFLEKSAIKEYIHDQNKKEDFAIQ